jgi:hypothetical protein
MKPVVQINNWSVIATINNPYEAPECTVTRLQGSVVNHANFEAGTNITTGRIISLDLKARKIETVNTIYQLDGPPDLKWVEFLKSANYDLSKLPE